MMNWSHAGFLTLALVMGATACGSKSEKKKDSSSESDEDTRKGKKTGKNKRVRETTKDGFLGILGEDGFNVFADLDEPEAIDQDGVLSFAGAEHSSTEPEKFSAGWAGREAGIVLKRAIDKEFESRTVTGGGGAPCLVFSENNIVRRLMINYDDWSYEYAMSQAGHIILWLGASRVGDKERRLAFFHRGNNLKLYQAWEDRGPRRTEPAPAGATDIIFSEANRCLAAAGASNPRPGSASVPIQPPAPPPPMPSTPQNETQPVEGVTYELVAKHSGLCLEIGGSSKENHARFTQAACTRADNQRFKLWTHENGVMISVVHSGQCVDVLDAGKDNGAALQQFPCGAVQNQTFLITPMATGEFRLAAKHSGRCFDVFQGSKDAGGAIVQWDCHESDNQRWLFRRVQ